MNKNITVAACLLATMVVACRGITTVSAASNIKFLTSSGTIDTLGYLHIFGEVQNIGTQTVKYVEIVGTFYNAGHVVIESEYTFTLLDQLEPGQKSPFDLFIMNAITSAEVAEYRLTVSGDATIAKPHGLQILSHSGSVDELGYLEIVGEIQNLRSGSASYVEVIGTFYDQNDTVIGCDYTFTDPSDLAGGETAPFKITFMYTPLSSLISSYALTAQSNEYSIVPEFSVPFFLIVPAAATLVFAVYRQKTRKLSYCNYELFVSLHIQIIKFEG